MKRMLLAASVALLLGGCKAAPAKSSGFLLNPELLSEPDHLPFHRAWAREGVAWDDYQRIYVAPVHTSYLADSAWWDQLVTDPDRDVERFADDLRGVIRDVIRKDPAGRLQVVDQIGPGTMILEVAIVELVPNKVVTNAAGMIAGLVVQGGGAIRSFTKGSIAFEAVVRDAESFEALAAFADREKTQFAVLNLENLTYYGFAEGILEEWAEQLRDVTKLGTDAAIQDSRTYKLNPFRRERTDEELWPW